MKKISIFLCMTFLISSDLYCPRKSTRNKNATSSFYSWLKGAGVLGTLAGVGYGVGKKKSDVSLQEATKQKNITLQEAAEQKEMDAQIARRDIAEKLYPILVENEQRELKKQADLIGNFEKKRQLESLKPGDKGYNEYQIQKTEEARQLKQKQLGNISEWKVLMKEIGKAMGPESKEKKENELFQEKVKEEQAKMKEERPDLLGIFDIKEPVKESVITTTPEAPKGYFQWGWNKIADTSKNIKDGLYTIGSQSMDFVANHKLALAGASIIGFTLWKTGVFKKIANMFYTEQLENDFKKSSGHCAIQFEFSTNGENHTVIVETRNGHFSSCKVLNAQLGEHQSKTKMLREALKGNKNLISVIQGMLNHFSKGETVITANIITSLITPNGQEEMNQDSMTFSKDEDSWMSSAGECYLVILKDLISHHKLPKIDSIKKEEREWIEAKGLKPTYCLAIRKHNKGWASMFTSSAGFAEIEKDDLFELADTFALIMSDLVRNESKNTTWDIEPSVRYEIDSENYIVYEFNPQQHTFSQNILEESDQQYTTYFEDHLASVFGGSKQPVNPYMQDEGYSETW